MWEYMRLREHDVAIRPQFRVFGVCEMTIRFIRFVTSHAVPVIGVNCYRSHRASYEHRESHGAEVVTGYQGFGMGTSIACTPFLKQYSSLRAYRLLDSGLFIATTLRARFAANCF